MGVFESDGLLSSQASWYIIITSTEQGDYCKTRAISAARGPSRGIYICGKSQTTCFSCSCPQRLQKAPKRSDDRSSSPEWLGRVCGQHSCLARELLFCMRIYGSSNNSLIIFLPSFILLSPLKFLLSDRLQSGPSDLETPSLRQILIQQCLFL
jgi:hypothetical protein